MLSLNQSFSAKNCDSLEWVVKRLSDPDFTQNLPTGSLRPKSDVECFAANIVIDNYQLSGKLYNVTLHINSFLNIQS